MCLHTRHQSGVFHLLVKGVDGTSEWGPAIQTLRMGRMVCFFLAIYIYICFSCMFLDLPGHNTMHTGICHFLQTLSAAFVCVGGAMRYCLCNLLLGVL